MSIQTVSVENYGKNDGDKVKRWDEMRGMGLRWDEWGEVRFQRSPSGCGDAIWPTGGRVHPPRRGCVAGCDSPPSPVRGKASHVNGYTIGWEQISRMHIEWMRVTALA